MSSWDWSFLMIFLNHKIVHPLRMNCIGREVQHFERVESETVEKKGMWQCCDPIKVWFMSHDDNTMIISASTMIQPIADRWFSFASVYLTWPQEENKHDLCKLSFISYLIKLFSSWRCVHKKTQAASSATDMFSVFIIINSFLLVVVLEKKIEPRDVVNKNWKRVREYGS